ncbi:hypothetical protein K435DRAFT_628284, partial [Dendrothele bispora CBS 962.96]
VNVICYLQFLGYERDIYAFGSSTDSDETTTSITPASWAFFTWSIMNVLMLGGITYQFLPEGKCIIIDTISWRFPLAAVQNTVLVNLLISHHCIMAFILALFILYYSIPCMSNRVQETDLVESASQKLFRQFFIHIPLSLYKGSITTLLVLTLFDAFSRKAEILAEIITFAGLLVLASASIVYSREGDLPSSITISWFLFALFGSQKTTALIQWTAHVLGIISILFI